MKLKILLLLITAYIHASGQNAYTGLILQTRLQGTYNFNESDSVRYYLVELELKNASDSSIGFTCYSCTTIANIVLDIKSVTICTKLCPENYLNSIELKPNQVFFIPIVLRVSDINVVMNQSLSIGFIWVNEPNQSRFTKAIQDKKKSQQDIIWSDPISLQISGNSYTIKQ